MSRSSSELRVMDSDAFCLIAGDPTGSSRWMNIKMRTVLAASPHKSPLKTLSPASDRSHT